jgi:uncharacterized protein YndB with AHSA1/START domain
MPVSSDQSSATQVGQRASNAEMVRQRRAPAPTGEVMDRGGAFAVCLGRSFSVTPETVWAWLTEPARTRIWLGEADATQRCFRLAGSAADAPRLSYEVECLEPPTRLVLSLRDDSLGGQGESWRIEIALTGTPQGSHVMLEQTVGDRVAAPSVAAACEFYLDRLVRVCHGRPLTDLDHDDYFLSQGATYRRMFPSPRGERDS